MCSELTELWCREGVCFFTRIVVSRLASLPPCPTVNSPDPPPWGRRTSQFENLCLERTTYSTVCLWAIVPSVWLQLRLQWARYNMQFKGNCCTHTVSCYSYSCICERGWGLSGKLLTSSSRGNNGFSRASIEQTEKDTSVDVNERQQGLSKKTWQHAVVLASILQSIPDSLTFHLICFPLARGSVGPEWQLWLWRCISFWASRVLP